jgi:diacylglycerol kinase family enzyme
VAPVDVLVNTRAGACGIAGFDAELRERFAARGLTARVVRLPDGADFRAAVHDAVNGAPITVAAGGDGTISAVAAELAGTPAWLGLIPLGTLNHFAKDLGIPLDLDKAIDVIAAGHTARVDVGTVNDRVFVNNSSIGLYPSLVQAREALRARGYRKYTAAVLAAIEALRTQHRVLVQVETSLKRAWWRTPFVMIGNNPYDVAGLRIAGRSRLDAGEVVAYIAPRVRVRDLPLSLIRVWLSRTLHRTGEGHREFRTVAGDDLCITVDGPRRLDVALDGEIVTLTQPLHYRSRPGALSVLVPAG